MLFVAYSTNAKKACSNRSASRKKISVCVQHVLLLATSDLNLIFQRRRKTIFQFLFFWCRLDDPTREFNRQKSERSAPWSLHSEVNSASNIDLYKVCRYCYWTMKWQIQRQRNTSGGVWTHLFKISIENKSFGSLLSTLHSDCIFFSLQACADLITWKKIHIVRSI